VTKKWGKKTREKVFPEHTNSIRKKCWEKNLRKKVRKNIFYKNTNVVTKKWGEKTRATIFPEKQ